MMPLPDHPAIARALRTGYPEPDKPLATCEDTSGCGAPIYPGDDYYEVDSLLPASVWRVC